MEVVPFSFSLLATAIRSYVGVAPPPAPGRGETGLVWWNPVTKGNQRWNGTIWEAMNPPSVACTTVSGNATITAVPYGFAVGAMVRIRDGGGNFINFGTAVPPVNQTTISS